MRKKTVAPFAEARGMLSRRVARRRGSPARDARAQSARSSRCEGWRSADRVRAAARLGKERAKRRLLDCFLQVLGGAEGDLLASLDFDRLAGCGIAAHARRALPNLEDAQAADADARAPLQMLGDVD